MRIVDTFQNVAVLALLWQNLFGGNVKRLWFVNDIFLELVFSVVKKKKMNSNYFGDVAPVGGGLATCLLLARSDATGWTWNAAKRLEPKHCTHPPLRNRKKIAWMSPTQRNMLIHFIIKWKYNNYEGGDAACPPIYTAAAPANNKQRYH